MLIEFAISQDKQTVFSVFQSARFCLLSHIGSFSSRGGKGEAERTRGRREVRLGRNICDEPVLVFVTGTGKNCGIHDGIMMDLIMVLMLMAKVHCVSLKYNGIDVDHKVTRSSLRLAKISNK